MATVKEINHDSSTTLSDFYSTINDPFGSISVTVAAALDGTTNGVETDFDIGILNPSIEETFTTLTGNDLKWRIRIKMSALTNSASDGTNCAQFILRNNSNQFLFDFQLLSAGGGAYKVLAVAQDDSDNNNDITSAVSVSSSDEICLEIRAIQETADGNSDGVAEFYIDGVSQGSISNVENFNRWNTGIDNTRVLFATTESYSGDLYYDEWILDDNGNANLGCGADLLTLSTIPKPASIDASGTFIYLALLNNGTPILSKISTALDADGITVFDPGTGDAIGVECGRFNANIVWIAGAFDGTNVVEKSEDAGNSFLIKDNATIGDIRAFVLGPDSDERLLIFDETNGDILETNDDGAIWNSINAAVTPEVNAIARLGENVQESVFGNDGAANDNVDYSVNSGTDLEDFNLPVNQNVTGVIVN